MDGAKNGTRTRDPNLGKVMLYQLSYFRNCVCKYKTLFFFWQISFTKIIKSERGCRRAGVAFPDLITRCLYRDMAYPPVVVG